MISAVLLPSQNVIGGHVIATVMGLIALAIFGATSAQTHAQGPQASGQTGLVQPSAAETQADTPLDIVGWNTSKHTLKVSIKPGQFHGKKEGWLAAALFHSRKPGGYAVTT